MAKQTKRKTAVSAEHDHAQRLDVALATVREGGEPHINGGNLLGTLCVIDPFDGKPRTKVVALRNDPVGQMAKRKQIDTIQLRAARIYQQLCEQSEIGGAHGIDHAKDKVDGGKAAEPDTDRRLQAAARLARIRAALGQVGTCLCDRVLADKMALAVVAQMTGRTSVDDYRALGKRFRECLDTIVDSQGLSVAGVSSKQPRDRFTLLALHSHDPELHKAERRAREGY